MNKQTNTDENKYINEYPIGLQFFDGKPPLVIRDTLLSPSPPTPTLIEWVGVPLLLGVS